MKIKLYILILVVILFSSVANAEEKCCVEEYY